MPAIPLSLYVHVPWCVRKCPYCDFNSHEAAGALPEREYVAALLADLAHDLPSVAQRTVDSLFIGGGTPSLLSPDAYDRLLAGLRRQLTLGDEIEITLEANPGTLDAGRCREYRALGINRLSIGVQSFDDRQLRALGRIHDRRAAIDAVENARSAGFENFNLDLMHGLPAQTPADAMADLDQAIALAPAHLSWYQLTIEPNTVFHARPPTLPTDDALADIEDEGFARLAAAGFNRYEVSAFARDGHECRHNRNYWEFGDYLALGAGAHGKLTSDDGQVRRYRKKRMPADYLAAAAASGKPAAENPFAAGCEIIQSSALAFEFMLNALRLCSGVPAALFPARTGLTAASIACRLSVLRERGLLDAGASRIACTETGLRFLNEVLAEFLPEP